MLCQQYHMRLLIQYITVLYIIITVQYRFIPITILIVIPYYLFRYRSAVINITYDYRKNTNTNQYQIRPCWHLFHDTGGTCARPRSILGLRDFCHFFTDFSFFKLDFRSFLAGYTVLSFKLKFKKFKFVFIHRRVAFKASAKRR